jgi:hypothetical protein
MIADTPFAPSLLLNIQWAILVVEENHSARETPSV